MRVFLFLPIIAAQPAEIAAAAETGRLRLQDGWRAYRYSAPPDAVAPVPLVIALHGDGGSARSMARITGFEGLAAEEGFAVVFPEGTGWAGLPPRGWNGGRCCGYAAARGIDDVAFLRDLIDHMVAERGVDPSRVYVAGISNGGFLAYRAGCELRERIAAVGAVAASMDFDKCSAARPLPVLILHGAKDEVIPIAGGASAADPNRVDPPLAAVETFWSSISGCGAATEDAEAWGRRAVYTGCVEGSALEVLLFGRGGHSWPGGGRGWLMGSKPVTEISASRELWEFFRRHRNRPSPES